MWYFSWILGLGLACSFAILNAPALDLAVFVNHLQGGQRTGLLALANAEIGKAARGAEFAPGVRAGLVRCEQRLVQHTFQDDRKLRARSKCASRDFRYTEAASVADDASSHVEQAHRAVIVAALLLLFGKAMPVAAANH